MTPMTIMEAATGGIPLQVGNRRPKAGDEVGRVDPQVRGGRGADDPAAHPRRRTTNILDFRL